MSLVNATVLARNEELQSLVLQFGAELSATKQALTSVTKERDILLASHERLRLDLELLQKRLFVAKAERVDTTQLRLEFAAKLQQLETMAETLNVPAKPETPKSKAKPTGRRDLRSLAIEDERVELSNPLLEQAVLEGRATRHGFEESVRLMRQRGGMKRLVTARVKYRSMDEEGGVDIITTPMPATMFPSAIAAPSLIAHIITNKICDGLPLYRIEDRFTREGVTIDRATMSRWLEIAGATFGATIIEAMRKDALANSFCIATDATGVSIQPIANEQKTGQACRKGHFLVQVADRDHVFYEYLERETSDNIGRCFKGYKGYIQADAKSVFDALYRPPDKSKDDSDDARTEVGCWSHARRKFWEATIAKSVVAREGLMRVHRIFAIDLAWAKKPPAERKRLRDAHLRPHIVDFFAWVQAEFEQVKDQRGLLSSALGYAHRQQAPLSAFLQDGRLVLETIAPSEHCELSPLGAKTGYFVARTTTPRVQAICSRWLPLRARTT